MASTETAETPQDCRCTKSGAEMLACACRRSERAEAAERRADAEAAPATLPVDAEGSVALHPTAVATAAETPD